MPNNYTTTLEISGDPEHAEDARRLVEITFQCRLPQNPDPRFENESPPVLAVMRMAPACFVPAELVKELSRRRPNLAFTLRYWNGMAGFRGHVTYTAGEVTDADREEFVLEELPRVPVSPDDSPGGYENQYDVDIETVLSDANDRAWHDAFVARTKAAVEVRRNWDAVERLGAGHPEAAT